MRMVAVVSTKLGSLKRYKCTCGHSEDHKEDQQANAQLDDAFNLEGFQEMPD
jgi:hypothetical protein